MDFKIVTKQVGDDRIFEMRSEEAVIGKLRCRWRKRVMISLIEIDKDHQRKGLGSALIHELIKQAVSDKIDCIECNISQQAEDEEGDIAYFLWRCGFTPWQQDGDVIRYVLWMWNDDAAVLKAAPAPDPMDADGDDDLDLEDAEAYFNSQNDVDPDNEAVGKKSALHEDPQIDPLGPEDMICGRCLYRMDGPNNGECRKYFYKPDTVFTEDKCEFYTG